MAIQTLNHSQIKSLLNEVYANFTGSNDELEIADLYANAFGDLGTNDINGLRDSWTGKLLATVTKRWYTDTSYRSSYNDLYFMDSREYGAIKEMVTVIAPEVTDNSAYKVSNGDTIGTYTINVPTVKTKYYGINTNAWAIKFAIKGERLNKAFESASSLEDFVAYVWLVIDNKIIEHLENLNALNRNQYIATKIDFANTSSIDGIHVVDLVNDYYTEVGETENKTSVDALQTPKFLLWAIKKLSFYKELLYKQTSLFNYDLDEETSYVRFVPKDRLVVEMLSTFNDTLDSVALSNTYHTEFVEKPLFSKVVSWSGLSGGLDFENLSRINVKTINNKSINTTGIVCLMVDKWAIRHSIVNSRIGHERKDVENVDIWELQHVDNFETDTSFNGIVFKLGSYIAPTK